MTRVSDGQRKLLQEASEKGLIVGEIPEYWNPKPLKNDQIKRLVERGFLVPDGNNFFKLTDAGKALVPPSPETNLRVDVDRLARSIVTAACELDGPAEPDGVDTISITMNDLEAVVHRHVTAALEASE